MPPPHLVWPTAVSQLQLCELVRAEMRQLLLPIPPLLQPSCMLTQALTPTLTHTPNSTAAVWDTIRCLFFATPGLR